MPPVKYLLTSCINSTGISSFATLSTPRSHTSELNLKVILMTQERIDTARLLTISSLNTNFCKKRQNLSSLKQLLNRLGTLGQ